MNGSTVESNSAKDDGGGIYSKGMLTINTSTLSDNLADSDSQGSATAARSSSTAPRSASSRAASIANTAPTRRRRAHPGWGRRDGGEQHLQRQHRGYKRRRVQRLGRRKPPEAQPEHRGEQQCGTGLRGRRHPQRLGDGDGQGQHRSPKQRLNRSRLFRPDNILRLQPGEGYKLRLHLDGRQAEHRSPAGQPMEQRRGHPDASAAPGQPRHRCRHLQRCQCAPSPPATAWR